MLARITGWLCDVAVSRMPWWPQWPAPVVEIAVDVACHPIPSRRICPCPEYTDARTTDRRRGARSTGWAGGRHGAARGPSELIPAGTASAPTAPLDGLQQQPVEMGETANLQRRL